MFSLKIINILRHYFHSPSLFSEFKGYRKKKVPAKPQSLATIFIQGVVALMIMILGSVAYWFTNYWGHYSIEVASVTFVVAATLILFYLNLIDGSWSFITAVLFVFLIILLTYVQQNRIIHQGLGENQTKVQEPPHYDDSIEESETSVMKPYPPSESPPHDVDNPPLESQSTPEESVTLPDTEPDTSMDQVQEPIEPEVVETEIPASVMYPGVPRAESPDDAQRVLSENGHDRKELETKYEGQVRSRCAFSRSYFII